MLWNRCLSPDRRRLIWRGRSASHTVTLFARQLATLLNAGMPLLRALETLHRQQAKGSFRQVIESLQEDLRAGSSLSEGLARHPGFFDELFVGMVRAGEASGQLSLILARVACFREKSARIRAKVKAALIYPVIVLLVASLIVGLLMALVVPQFEDVFQGMLRGQPLPYLTEIIIRLSGLIREHGLWLLLTTIGIALAIKCLCQTSRGERLWHGLLLQVPLTGGIVQRVMLARYTRTFGTLLRTGVPLLEALKRTRDVVGNAVMREWIDRQHDRVRDGESITAPLRDASIIPPMVAGLLHVGEESGQLSEMCDLIADTYEEETDTAVAGLTSILEPLMIVLLALIVGTIVIALFLPIASLIQHLSLR